MGFVVPTATTMTPNSGDTMNQMGESTTTNGGGGTSAPASNGGTVAAVVIVVLICVVASIVVGVLLLRRLQSQKAQLEQQQQAAAGGGGSGAPSSSSHYSQPRDSAAYTPVASAGGYSKSPINNQYGNLSLTQPLGKNTLDEQKARFVAFFIVPADEHSTYTSMPSERDIATASSASSSAAS
jgi:mannitol-specific phosphotransferase system IIBC component